MIRPTSILLLASVSACGNLDGFGGEVPALSTFAFEIIGDFEAVRATDASNESLHVAVVWGAQWLPEPLCVLPPESAEVAALVAAGCRDPLSFVPDRASATVPARPNEPGSVSLFALPSSDVMVGTVTGRIAYASLVVFDDRDGTGALELSRSRNVPGGDEGHVEPGDEDPPPGADLVYGASFVTMTEPDVRIVLREGTYNERAAFYPRFGCGEPAPGFSIAAAGGFTTQAAISATLAGSVPAQDPATCREEDPEEVVVPISLRSPAQVSELRCVGRRGDSSVRYRQPPVEPPALTNRVTACAKVPRFGSDEAEDIVQLVVSSRSDEPCKGLTHYLLRGCEEDAACVLPEWDITATPPAWWTCPTQAP